LRDVAICSRAGPPAFARAPPGITSAMLKAAIATSGLGSTGSTSSDTPG